METPICDFVREYARSGALRLHMPGHKGLGFLGVEKLDITEIDGADVLYRPGGIIRKSEENAARLFGSARTLYSAEGSSLSVRAMLFMALLYARDQGKRPVIAAARNAHSSFVTAAALLGADVGWLWPSEGDGLTGCSVTPEAVEELFSAPGDLPAAVYITSPDYLGNTADIGGIAQVCHRHGALLLVDNAHGAYLRFLPESRHPLDLGADLCCDSAHKTLPVLTGGGYLHIAKGAPEELCDMADGAMAVFASTSPSYLILQSLDMANNYLACGYAEKLARAAKLWAGVKTELEKQGFELCGDEPLKLTLRTGRLGYSGADFARELANRGIVCEYSDRDSVVMMLSAEWDAGRCEEIKNVILSVPKRKPLASSPPPLCRLEAVMSAREALLSPYEEVDAKSALGRVVAAPCVNCPPAVSVAVCGERIDAAALRVMEYYGIDRVRVVK